MPNNEEKLRKEREARYNAYKQKQAQKEASDKEKNSFKNYQDSNLDKESIPFKNIDIDRMNAQKNNFG